METTTPDGREEKYNTMLPAWSALSPHDLSPPGLGLDEAANVLRRSFDLSAGPSAARQAAVARYPRTGFEAAAVTGLGFRRQQADASVGAAANRRDSVRAPLRCRGRRNQPAARIRNAQVSPWTRLPVFSAWVGKAENAD